MLEIRLLTRSGLAIGFLIGLLVPAWAQSLSPPNVRITPLGTPGIVSDWRRDRCETIDTPDSPARAFRDAAGQVHLIASHYVARELTGPTLDTVRPRCAVAFTSGLQRGYAAYRNHQWLSGFYSIDGTTVHALVHNEFHGDDDPPLCPSHQFADCWWNSVTYAISTDGGYHFHEPADGNRLVAVLPYPYATDSRQPAGYFNPSNIVTLDGAYYAFIKATAYRAQQAGSCLVRTTTLDRPDSWRAWDGEQFSVTLSNPAARPPDQHVCVPIPNISAGDVGGLSRDEATGAFVGIMLTMLPDAAGHPVCGFWATASFDLLQWSPPVLVAPDPAGPSTCDPSSEDYPSILDPDSASRNFETFGPHPYLYFVRVNLRHPPYDRQLLRQRIGIAVQPAAPH